MKNWIRVPPKMLLETKQLTDAEMCADDKITATHLQELLASHAVYVSLSTILRCQKQGGWVYISMLTSADSDQHTVN